MWIKHSLQLMERAYAEQYPAADVRLTLIGFGFSKTERNIVGFDTQVQTQS